MPNEHLTEEDVKRIRITPTIERAGWRHIRMEYYFTDGRIYPGANGTFRRGKAKKADYLLNHSPDLQLAIVEAKDGEHDIRTGLLQAIEYARILNVPFAYSTNGEGMVEHDLITEAEREITMAEFPSPEVLYDRYLKEKSLSEEDMKVIDSQMYISNGFFPRYYQKAAIDMTLEAIVKGQKRCLIVEATGTGKTYTAFQIIWRLKQARKIRKVLYLADRNILIQKPFNEEFAPFGTAKTIIKHGKIETQYEVFFGLYQQLNQEKGAEEYQTDFDVYKQVAPSFFDLIIVDECHRGSAKENSEWHKILEYFGDAIQIGMTATPRIYGKVGEDGEPIEDTAKKYFGDPIYTYSLKDGIEDGFLAPYKVVKPILDIDVQGYRPGPDERDIYGNILEDRVYTQSDFDRILIVDSRTREVAKQIMEYVRDNGPYIKTVVFCCNIDHAARMRQELHNLSLDLCRKNPRYITQITGDQPTADADLEDFTKVEFNPELDPCIVTTSDLMTTGVDCKTAKLIVIDKVIKSMTLFKQIIGRGTRIRLDANKYEFAIMDFRNATALFADPGWDGIPVVDDTPTSKGKDGEGEEWKKYHISGGSVSVLKSQVQILCPDGKLVTVSLIDYTKKNILGAYATLDDFINRWGSGAKKKTIMDELLDKGVFIDEVRDEVGVPGMDDFDLLAYVAYGLKPMSRSERINKLKKSLKIEGFSEAARDVIDALLEKYCEETIDDVDDVGVLRLNPFTEIGTPKHIIKDIFGGRDNYLAVMSQIKSQMFRLRV